MENINLLILCVIAGVLMGQAMLNFINNYLMFFPIRGRQFLSIIYLVLSAIAFYMEVWVATGFLFITSILTLGTAMLTEYRMKSQQVMLEQYMKQQNGEKSNESGRTIEDAEQGIDEQEVDTNEGDNSSA